MPNTTLAVDVEQLSTTSLQTLREEIKDELATRQPTATTPDDQPTTDRRHQEAELVEREGEGEGERKAETVSEAEAVQTQGLEAEPDAGTAATIAEKALTEVLNALHGDHPPESPIPTVTTHDETVIAVCYAADDYSQWVKINDTPISKSNRVTAERTRRSNTNSYILRIFALNLQTDDTIETHIKKPTPHGQAAKRTTHHFTGTELTRR